MKHEDAMMGLLVGIWVELVVISFQLWILIGRTS